MIVYSLSKRAMSIILPINSIEWIHRFSFLGHVFCKGATMSACTLGMHYISSKVFQILFENIRRYPLVINSTIKRNQDATANGCMALLLLFQFHLHFSQSVWYFGVIKYLFSSWEIGGRFPSPFVIIIAFPLDLISLAACDTRQPLTWGIPFYHISILSVAMYISYSVNSRKRRFLSRSICGVLLESTDVYCIMDHHICQ